MTQNQVTYLESQIETFNADLAPLSSFVLPGGSSLATHLHLVRTISRRAERTCITLNKLENINHHILLYLNRLSDLSFVLARYANKIEQGDVVMDTRSKSIEKIGIIGSGIMGTGIARVFLTHQFHVILQGLNISALEKAIQKINTPFLSTTINIQDLEDCDFIIEAMSEDAALKKQVLRELSEIVSPSCILASNTSSFSISELSESVKHPQRFMGVHFMNPPHKMPLVELIASEHTSLLTQQSVKDLMIKIGKKTVECKDRPGFLVNRILFRMILEAMRVLQEKTAHAADIDQALKLGANLPMGPLELADFIGLDTCLSYFKNVGCRYAK